MNSRVAVRYARALMKLAEDRNEVEKIEEEFIALIHLLHSRPNISRLILNSIIPLSEKISFIQNIFGGKCLPLLLNFLKVLIQKQRFNEIYFIQKEYHRLHEKQKGILEVQALSAIPLAQKTKERLHVTLKKLLESEIRLITQTNPSLLGGLILRFDGMEINASFRHRLEELKYKLMKS